MKTMEAIKVLVTARIHDAYGEFPVVVTESPEDSTTLWVQVFAVPDERVREVKNLILALQEQVLPEGDVLLLPMVKNLSVTRAHYPQHAPCDSSEMLALIGSIMDDLKEERIVLRRSKRSAAGNVAKRTFGPESLQYEKIGATALKSRTTHDTMAAANTELALAA